MEMLRYACQDLFRRRGQMALTACGIAIGVYSVLVIATIGQTGQAVIDRELQKMGFDCIAVSVSDKTLGQMDEGILENIRNMEEVELAAPLITSFGQVVMREYIGDAVVCGIDPSAAFIMEILLKNGRFLQKGDIAGAEDVCLVDDSLAQAYYKRDNIVGKKLSLTVNGVERELEVVGVVSSDQSTLKNIVGNYIPAFVYLPYTTCQKFFGRETVDQVFVRISEEKDPLAAGTAITEALNRIAGYTNLYRFEDLAAQKERIHSIVSSVTAVLAAIGAVSLIVSGLSIMTIMMVSVRDRTREIGVKKAIGATEWDILSEFLIESLILALLGSLLGALGCAVTAMIAGLFTGITFVLNLQLFLGVALLSSVAGGIFGIYPARLAAKLRPVDALRHE